MTAKLWVSFDLREFAKWSYGKMSKGEDPDFKIFLRDLGVSRIEMREPSFLQKLLNGWIEVPTGSCVRLNLSRGLPV